MAPVSASRQRVLQSSEGASVVSRHVLPSLVSARRQGGSIRQMLGVSCSRRQSLLSVVTPGSPQSSAVSAVCCQCQRSDASGQSLLSQCQGSDVPGSAVLFLFGFLLCLVYDGGV